MDEEGNVGIQIQIETPSDTQSPPEDPNTSTDPIFKPEPDKKKNKAIGILCLLLALIISGGIFFTRNENPMFNTGIKYADGCIEKYRFDGKMITPECTNGRWLANQSLKNHGDFGINPVTQPFLEPLVPINVNVSIVNDTENKTKDGWNNPISTWNLTNSTEPFNLSAHPTNSDADIIARWTEACKNGATNLCAGLKNRYNITLKVKDVMG